MNKFVFFSLLGLMFTGCYLSDMNSTPVGSEDAVSADLKIQKTVPLPNDFTIDAGRGEDFEKFETFTLFKISRAGKELFMDTTVTEYEFGDTLYPLLRHRTDGTTEILVEVNDRPNKNYLKLFRIKNDKVLQIDSLPTFDSGPANLDEDANPEYTGVRHWGENWGENEKFTAYNPTLIYEDAPGGFCLDTSLTIKINTGKYGKFYGYRYDEKNQIEIKHIRTDN